MWNVDEIDHMSGHFQVDELQIVQSEITLLFNELETLRRQKHAVEEERAENDKLRDKEVKCVNLKNMATSLSLPVSWRMYIDKKALYKTFMFL